MKRNAAQQDLTRPLVRLDDCGRGHTLSAKAGQKKICSNKIYYKSMSSDNYRETGYFVIAPPEIHSTNALSGSVCS